MVYKISENLCTRADYVPMAKEQMIRNVEDFCGETVCESEVSYLSQIDPYQESLGGEQPALTDSDYFHDGFILASDEKFKPLLEALNGNGWKSVFHEGEELPAFNFTMLARRRKVIFIENKGEHMTYYTPLLGNPESALTILWVTELDTNDHIIDAIEQIKGGLV